MSKLIQEIENSIKSNDCDTLKEKIPLLISLFNKTEKRFQKVLAQSDKQQLKVLKLTEELEKTNQKVKLLLDNAGEGFLTFNNEMIIDDEYSKMAKDIFNQPLENKKITTLLYPDNPKKANFLEDTLKDILVSNSLKQEVLLSLLPKEFIINDRIIYIQYKVINDKFMLILNDITEKKNLEEKAKKEQQTLKMVVDFITSFEQFQEIEKDYKKLANHIENYKKDLSLFRMHVHTFKGLFAQKEMIHIVDFLHELENHIDKCIEENIVDEYIQNLTPQMMLEKLEEDLKIIREILGDSFFKEYIKIEKERIESIFNKLKPTKNFALLNEVRDLMHVNIKDYLSSYKNLVRQLSNRLNKEVEVYFDIADNIYLPKRFLPFLNSLVHLFRNSLDHGIEESGVINFKITKDDKYLYIDFSDNGKGIKEDILPHIFEEGFSTKNEVTLLSGRGVGLNSVKEEVDKLDGEIDVIVNNGTIFKFKIPLNNIIQKLVKQINHNLNINLKPTTNITNQYHTTMDVYGEVNGAVYLAINKKFAEELTYGLGEEYIQDGLDEFLNIILGNILVYYDLEISTPYRKKEAPDNLLSFEYNDYLISISFEG